MTIINRQKLKPMSAALLIYQAMKLNRIDIAFPCTEEGVQDASFHAILSGTDGDEVTYSAYMLEDTMCLSLYQIVGALTIFDHVVSVH